MSLPTYLMSNFPSVRPSLNLQFDSQPTPEDMTSHLASVGATFSRASIGTYTDANGLIQEASAGQARPNYSSAGVHEGLLIEESRTNLVKSSEDFSTTDWDLLSNGTGLTPIITKNQAIAPDGTASADKIVFDVGAGTTTSDSSQVNQTITFPDNTDGTVSVWLKGESGGEQITFRGVAGTVYQLLTLTTEWQRFTTTEDSGTNFDSILFGIRQNVSGHGVINSTAAVYVWGAQLEAGSFPTSYIPTIPTFSSRASTATYFDSSGVLQTASIDEARTDHKYINGQWVEAGLLLEGASTNLVTSSEDFNDTSWSKVNSPTITVNDAVAPDGTTTADLLTDPYSGLSARIEDTVTVSDDSNNYCASLFIKKEASEAYALIQLHFQGGSTVINYAIRIRKDTGSFTDEGTNFSGSGADAVDLGVEDYGDYWRVYLVGGNNGTGNITAKFRIFMALTSSNGYTTGSTTVWGAQLEQQSQPTSYIPTSGSTATRSADVYTTATKTRSADVCYIDGTAFTDFYNQEQGTVLIDFDTESYGSTQNLVSINDGTSNNRYVWYFASSGFLNFRKVVSGSNNQVNSGSSITTFLPDIKMVAYYDLSGAGFLIEKTDGNSLSETTQLNLNKLEINSITKWTIKKFIYFPRKLSTAEFEKLTQ